MILTTNWDKSSAPGIVMGWKAMVAFVNWIYRCWTHSTPLRNDFAIVRISYALESNVESGIFGSRDRDGNSFVRRYIFAWLGQVDVQARIWAYGSHFDRCGALGLSAVDVGMIE